MFTFNSFKKFSLLLFTFANITLYMKNIYYKKISALKNRFFQTLFYSFLSICALAQNEVNTAKQYLFEHATKEKISVSEIEEMRISSQYLSPTTGWYHIYFNQTFQSVDVYNGLISLVLKDNKVAYVANSFAQSGIASAALPIGNFLEGRTALEKATVALNMPVTSIATTKEISSSKLSNGKTGKVFFEDKNISNEKIEVSLYWLPVEVTEGEKIKTLLKLSWNVVIAEKNGQHKWNVQVDANTGEILQKKDDVIHCDFGKPDHVHENEIENSIGKTGVNKIENNIPYSPTANGYTVFDYPLEAPTFGARTLVASPYTRFAPAGVGPGVTNGWHNDGAVDYTYTRGNNVWAKDDLANDNETTLGSNPISATLDFNYPYTLSTATAAGNLNACITNLFYWNNVIHDVLWRYGFDEPSGNFQNNNQGKGGLGNDFVQADAQDGSGTSNANFSTPSDGGNGRMQMYIWANVGSPLYQPDSDFDNGVIAHEYGHGWSIRLTGGPANSGCLGNAEQGGEGWGDYNALMLTTNWASLTPTVASANIPRGIGTYVIGQATSGGGIRPFRYSYNKAVVNNTVTYGKVADAAGFSLPHGIGSIWATMLWDMTWEIILQDNFIAPNIYDVPALVTNMKGNIAAYKLVNEGLRLQACSPSFVQARDAIFQADAMLFAGRYHCAIGKAFARRGLGLNASTGVSGNDRIVTEDFTAFSGPVLNSLMNNVACSNQPFVYTATVAATGAYTFSWTRPTVVGISNVAGSGSTATINEVLVNTTSNPIAVKYLITVSPDECGGTPAAQSVTVIVNPSVTPTVNTYSVCQNATVPVGQGLVAPSILANTTTGTIVVGATYARATGNNVTTYTAAAGVAGSAAYFRTYTFVAPASGAVTFSTESVALTPGDPDDTFLSIYATSFNPAAPATNFLRGDDDSGLGFQSLFTHTLVAGSTYVIVVTTYSNGVTGNFTLIANNANIFPGTNNWYLNASGGAPLATGQIFNPVGVAGSGIANTATAGTTTFYVANALFSSCRTAVNFTVSPTTLYVNAAATGTNNGATWANAFTDLQPALASVGSCVTQIWVAAGTYKPTTGLNRDLSFALKNNVAIYGGFPNTGMPIFTQRNPTTNVTTLSGDIGLANDATDNSYHVISNGIGLSNTAILDGFVIANGNANGTGSFRNAGGAMLNNPAGASNICNPKIDNCIFRNNNATNGGAVYNNGVSATASPIFTNCVFRNNTAANGAAFYNDGSTTGISNPTIINATFTENAATTSGNLVNSTATGGTSISDFTNCIFWNNGGANTFSNNASSINAKYSLFEPLVNNYTNGAGNITTTVSPFVLASDVHLRDSSTAIDAGTAVGAPTKDIDFAVRTAMPDMGAYENFSACLGVNKFYVTDMIGTSYQWQKDDGSGYVDILNGALFSNVTTQKLTLINPANITTGTKYRCKITNGVTITYSPENVLRFYNRWLGGADNNWLNPANWSCGAVPNQYIDVIIPASKPLYPITNVNGSIRKLQTEIGSNISVATGSNLIIVGQ
jgi:hypothetical protein